MDDLEKGFRAGAVLVLRRRAERQRQIVQVWTVHGEKGQRIMSGEGRVAERIAAALDAAADDLESGATR